MSTWRASESSGRRVCSGVRDSNAQQETMRERPRRPTRQSNGDFLDRHHHRRRRLHDPPPRREVVRVAVTVIDRPLLLFDCFCQVRARRERARVQKNLELCRHRRCSFWESLMRVERRRWGSRKFTRFPLRGFRVLKIYKLFLCQDHNLLFSLSLLNASLSKRVVEITIQSRDLA